MVPAHEVTDAVLAALRATGTPVGDEVAPSNAAAPYGILKSPPGGGTHGDWGNVNRDATYLYRIIGVGHDPTSSHLARKQAQWCHDRLLAALLPTGAVAGGDTWSVRGVHVDSFNGVDVEGASANASSDVRITVNG